MCRNPLLGEDITIQVKTNHEYALLNALEKLHQHIRELEILTTKLSIYLGITLGLATMHTGIFFYSNPEYFWGFLGLFKYIYYCFFFIIDSLIINFSIWIWAKIGMYVMSFFVLGIFVVLQNNGNIPLFVR